MNKGHIQAERAEAIRRAFNPPPAPRLTADNVNVTVNPNGSVTVSAIVGDYREARTYYFATKEEAVVDYLAEMNGEE